MKRANLLIIFIITFLINPFGINLSFSAEKLFNNNSDFEERIKRGIDYIYNIQFDSAEVIFKQLMLDYPQSPAGRFFLAMIDWWKIAIDPDNENHDEIFLEKLEDVIFQCEQILKKDEKNLDAIFFKGGAIGFRGRLRALRDSWIKAADDGREALPLLQYAWSIDSTNYDILFGMGIYNYFAEVIPNEYPFIKPLMIFFPKGNKNLGIQQLKVAAEKAKYASTESKYFLLTLYYHFENDIYQAQLYATDLHRKYPMNPIFHRYLGRTYVRYGDYDTASKIFLEVYNRSKSNLPGYNKNAMREAAYYIGMNYRLEGKYDSSAYFFLQCVNISKEIDEKGNESGFQASAALNLGIVNDLMGKREDAINYYNYVLSIKDWSDSHASAKKYLNSPYGK
ncbi:MAG: tetratricopeptide repeat protein [Ignavibacteria bacterium]|nr:tetratricopeptide repeat protein [Ignavibacteria bacterium]